MHPGAYNFVAYMARCLPPRRRVCELGSRDINGSVRGLFPGAEYVGLDIAPGPGVDVIADAATWKPEPPNPFDTVVSTETLEHTPDAERICRNAHELLVPGGVFIVTAASDGRPAHSAVDGCQLREGEFYRNITPTVMRQWLEMFCLVMIDTGNAMDVYALAVK
jgi:SAM-dependent methyltransferase